MTTEAKPERKVATRYGHCSRGRCWGKWYPGKTRPTGDFVWVEKDDRGNLYPPSEPGHLVYGSDDGFRRKQRDSQTYLTDASDD